jgi:hypothetical protein
VVLFLAVWGALAFPQWGNVTSSKFQKIHSYFLTGVGCRAMRGIVRGLLPRGAKESVSVPLFFVSFGIDKGKRN